jgi:hypothetical protein
MWGDEGLMRKRGIKMIEFAGSCLNGGSGDRLYINFEANATG